MLIDRCVMACLVVMMMMMMMAVMMMVMMVMVMMMVGVTIFDHCLAFYGCFRLSKVISSTL